MSEVVGAEMENVQGRRYPGYGVCIYCGNTGGADGLGDEHIIPLSLNGDAVIEEASCRSCARKIDPADRHFGKTVFWHFRLHTGAKTRKPKDRPKVLGATIEIDGKEFQRDFTVKEAPFTMALPLWGAAGFFRSAPIDAPFPETFVNLYHWAPPDIREKLGLAENEEFRIWSAGGVNTELFARAIAKIAYCHLVVKFGLHGFRRLALPDIVLGKSSATPYFVGTPLTLPLPPLDRRVLHHVEHVTLESQRGPLKLHRMNIRLFANSAHKDHGMPIYHVIAGAPK